jgi:hypothetical protein
MAETPTTPHIAAESPLSNQGRDGAGRIQRKWFISFGAPTPEYHNRVSCICRQAKALETAGADGAARPFFDGSTGFTEKSLMSDRDFWAKHGDFIASNKRGYGYWLWKPYIIHRALSGIEDGDILVYADAGCSINASGLKRLGEYMSMLNSSDKGVIAFRLNHAEVIYTKKEVFSLFGANWRDSDETSKDIFSNQYMATVIMLRKTAHSVNLVREWFDICGEHAYINDVLSASELPPFRDHRHDQSIFSMLVKKHGAIELPDETWFHPRWAAGVNYPFWATRLRM